MPAHKYRSGVCPPCTEPTTRLQKSHTSMPSSRRVSPAHDGQTGSSSLRGLEERGFMITNYYTSGGRGKTIAQK